MSGDYRVTLARIRDEIAREAAAVFDDQMEEVSSPIEKLFLAAMLLGHWTMRWDMSLSELHREKDMRLLAEAGVDMLADERTEILCLPWGRPGLAAAAQPVLHLADRDIRPDFVFVFAAGEHSAKIVVELDGHDFHERSPKQAQSDKSRDRALQALGWHVMRFTGREVLRDPARCYHEVMSLLVAKAVLAERAERASR